MEKASATLGTAVSELVESQKKQDTCVQKIVRHSPQPDATEKTEEDEKIISEAERNLEEKESQELPYNETTSLEDIHKLHKAELPPDMQLPDLKNLQKIYHVAESITILMTGKTGSGKSTLTNGILGVKVRETGPAQEGNFVLGCTKMLTEYRTKKGKIEVIVWDSPGLQDGTKNQEEYLQQMKEKCSGRDLTVYCTRISDIRFVRGDDNPDVRAMAKLNRTFGVEFWKTTIIMLTFANTLEAFNVDWEDLSDADKAKAYKEKIQEWENQIKEVLIQDIEVPEEIANAVRVIPAGHYKKPHLPGYPYWLSALWFHCVATISTPEVQAALLKMNVNRFKGEKDVTKNDFKKTADQQPIVVNDDTIKIFKHPVKIAIGSAAGATVGGMVGLVGLLGGPLAIVTVPAGSLIGMGIGGLLAAAIAKIVEFH